MLAKDSRLLYFKSIVISVVGQLASTNYYFKKLNCIDARMLQVSKF